MKPELTQHKLKRFKETAEELLQIARAGLKAERDRQVMQRRRERTDVMHARLREALYRRVDGESFAMIAEALGVTKNRARELTFKAVRVFAGWRGEWPPAPGGRTSA